MQGEVGEVAEPSGTGRGGSSTMPHKRNPSGCVVALAAANRVPGMVVYVFFPAWCRNKSAQQEAGRRNGLRSQL